jgi:hypothetical protein
MIIDDLRFDHVKPGLRIFSSFLNSWGVVIAHKNTEIYIRWDAPALKLRTYTYRTYEVLSLSVLTDSNGQPVYVNELLIDFP